MELPLMKPVVEVEELLKRVKEEQALLETLADQQVLEGTDLQAL
jgi:hypothetical protein